MKIAIMQPYLFPYLGYFQLIAAVDKFIILDDVNYKKKGWINRNNILLDGNPYTFTMPISSASQNTKINQLYLPESNQWARRFLKTIAQAYGRARHFQQVSQLLEEILTYSQRNLSDYLSNAIVRVCGYIGMGTEIIGSSSVYGNSELKSEQRIIDICVQMRATKYINSPGGRALYKSESFDKYGIELEFLPSLDASYRQWTDTFTPNLSIIDAMMFNSPSELAALLDGNRIGS